MEHNQILIHISTSDQSHGEKKAKRKKNVFDDSYSYHMVDESGVIPKK